MNKISKNNPLNAPDEHDYLAHLPYEPSIDERLERIESNISRLASNVASLEDAIAHFAAIPNRPLDLIYDHTRDTLWCQGERRRISFTGNEAVILRMMFTKTTKLPKGTKFFCAEVAENLKNKREDINTAAGVFQTVKRVNDKLEAFLNAKNVIIVSTKYFQFSELALEKDS